MDGAGAAHVSGDVALDAGPANALGRVEKLRAEVQAHAAEDRAIDTAVKASVEKAADALPFKLLMPHVGPAAEAINTMLQSKAQALYPAREPMLNLRLEELGNEVERASPKQLRPFVYLSEDGAEHALDAVASRLPAWAGEELSRAVRWKSTDGVRYEAIQRTAQFGIRQYRNNGNPWEGFPSGALVGGFGVLLAGGGPLATFAGSLFGGAVGNAITDGRGEPQISPGNVVRAGSPLIHLAKLALVDRVIVEEIDAYLAQITAVGDALFLKDLVTNPAARLLVMEAGLKHAKTDDEVVELLTSPYPETLGGYRRYEFEASHDAFVLEHIAGMLQKGELSSQQVERLGERTLHTPQTRAELAAMVLKGAEDPKTIAWAAQFAEDPQVRAGVEAKLETFFAKAPSIEVLNKLLDGLKGAPDLQVKAAADAVAHAPDGAVESLRLPAPLLLPTVFMSSDRKRLNQNISARGFRQQYEMQVLRQRLQTAAWTATAGTVIGTTIVNPGLVLDILSKMPSFSLF